MRYKGYGQYCPLALAAGLICERWTLMIVSRLIDGCRRFNDIHRGVPKISPTLLKQRFNRLQDAGVCYRSPIEEGRWHEYLLTEAGKGLKSIVMDLAVWVQRWSRDLRNEIVSDRIMVEGKMEFRRALPDWLCGSTPGSFEPSYPGPKRDLYCAIHSVTAE